MSRELPIVFRSEGQQVVAMLHLPAGKGPFPAVAFLHGFTGSKSESHRIFVQLARALAGAGVASLRMDFRGSGDSEGEFSQMTVAGEVADARAALRHLRRRRDIRFDCLGLLGMSMGGMVASLVAAGDPALRAIVLWNPVADPKALRDRRYTESSQAQLAAMGVVDWYGWAVGAAFLSELESLDPLGAAARVAAPVLIVQASEDQTVPRGEAEMYREARERAGRPVSLYSVEGADHTFSSLAWTAEAMAASLAWFGCHLLDRAP